MVRTADNAPGLDRFCPAIDTLMVRMSHGDREAAAEFVQRYGPQVRRRIHGKIGPSLCRVFDSQDILSTVGRRLDLLVMSGKLHVENQGQLWSLLCSMAEHAVIEKARTIARFQRIESAESAYAREQTDRTNRACTTHAAEPKVDIDSCLRALDDPRDRQILVEVLAGESQKKIASHTLMSIATVRRHWKKIKATLRE